MRLSFRTVIVGKKSFPLLHAGHEEKSWRVMPCAGGKFALVGMFARNSRKIDLFSQITFFYLSIASAAVSQQFTLLASETASWILSRIIDRREWTLEFRLLLFTSYRCFREGQARAVLMRLIRQVYALHAGSLCRRLSFQRVWSVIREEVLLAADTFPSISCFSCSLSSLHLRRKLLWRRCRLTV